MRAALTAGYQQRPKRTTLTEGNRGDRRRIVEPGAKGKVDASRSPHSEIPQQCPDKIGFIDGPVLRSNVTEHESGNVKGHYEQYSAALAIPSNNLGTIAESLTAPPGTSIAAFVDATAIQLNDAVNRVTTAMAVEACNLDVRLGPTCASIVPPEQDPAFGGFINFSPYQRCR